MNKTNENTKLNEKLNQLGMMLAENEPFDELELYTRAQIELVIENDEIVLTFDGSKVKTIDSYEDIAEFIEEMEERLTDVEFEENSVDIMEMFDYELYAYAHVQEGTMGVLMSNIGSDIEEDEKEEISYFFEGFDFEKIKNFFAGFDLQKAIKEAKELK